ncbi:MAG: hypothetical protein Q8Q12_19580 [bacterium]|nr:hypothetical protein [bacterium]
MSKSSDTAAKNRRPCPLLKKDITGVQCQLYQGVEYKNSPVCKSCSYRNEVNHGGRKQ